MKKYQKLLSFLLAAVLCLSLAPASGMAMEASADEPSVVQEVASSEPAEAYESVETQDETAPEAEIPESTEVAPADESVPVAEDGASPLQPTDPVGDVNGDSAVTLADAIAYLKDGNVYNALLVLRQIVGLDKPIEVEPTPTHAPTATPSPTPTPTAAPGGDSDFSGAQVGDIITFGHYEQDNDLTNGAEPIKWRVLAREGDQILVISEYGLDAKPYNENFASVTWETCTLRGWLNDDFLNAAFTASEQALIPTVEVVNKRVWYTTEYDWNPVTEQEEEVQIEHTAGGNETQDKVFLLSIDEAEEYFPTDADRVCKATMYVRAQGASVATQQGYAGNCWWWLRSPGSSSLYAAYVFPVGSVYSSGNGVGSRFGSVRPALWINLGS